MAMVACLLKWAGLGWENKSPSHSWEFGRSHKWWPLLRSSRSAHMLSLAQSTLLASPSACSSSPSSGFPHQSYTHVAYWLLGWHLVCGFCFWESFILLLLFIPPNRYLLYTSPLSPPTPGLQPSPLFCSPQQYMFHRGMTDEVMRYG